MKLEEEKIRRSLMCSVAIQGRPDPPPMARACDGVAMRARTAQMVYHWALIVAQVRRWAVRAAARGTGLGNRDCGS